MELVSDCDIGCGIVAQESIEMDTGEKICEESSSDAVVSSVAVLETKNGTVTIELDSDVKEVQDLVDDVRFSGDERTVVMENGEKVMESSLDDVLSNCVISVSNGLKVGTELLGLETGSVMMEMSVYDGGGGVRDSVDGGRISGDERTSVIENSEKVLDESSLDGVVLSVPPNDVDIVVSNGVELGADLLESKSGALTMEPVSDNDGGGGIDMHDSVDDARDFENEKGIVTEKDKDVLDESSLDAVVSSVPLSNSDIAASNKVEVEGRADVLESNTENRTTEPSYGHEGDVGINVHRSVNDIRVTGGVGINSDIAASNEVEVECRADVLESNTENQTREPSYGHEGGVSINVIGSVNDVRVSGGVGINSDIAASNEVEVEGRADVLESNTENRTTEPSYGHEGGVSLNVIGSVNDVRVSGDEKEIVMGNIEKVLNESSSVAGVLSVPPSHSDISASNMVKIGAESLDSKTGTLMMEPSSDRIASGGIAVQYPIDDARVSEDEKEIVMKDVEKVFDENEVNDEEKEGKYKVTDLVWAKVKNYPWWPGQIFDPSASTDKAKKFSNKKGFLIAYFGDQSFAWNKTSNIKPFRKNFLKMEKQGKSKSFHHAVNCALDEVSRRIDFGLACSCLSKEVYNNIKSQVFVNAGIKKEASVIEGGDNFSTVSTFKPVNIVQSVQDLAREHFDGISRLEVLSVRTQILAYLRWKGYNQLSTQFLGGLDDNLGDNSELPLMEEDKVVEDAQPISVSTKVSSKKRKLNADTGDVVLNDKSEDDSELSLMEEDKVVEDEKTISVSAQVSSKKKKLNGDNGDSVPRMKEKGLKNVTAKGKSTLKSKSKKNSGDSGDSALDDKLEDESELPLMEDDKVVEDAKPTSVSVKVSSKRKKSNDCDSGDSVPRKKEKYLKNVTQKENSNVKSKSKKNSEKKVTIEGSGFKEKSRNANDDSKISISPPKKIFRIGETICRIAKQLSESPLILKKEPMKSKNDETSVEQTEPPSIHKKKSKKSKKTKNDEKCVEQTESHSILKKEFKKSKNDEKSVEQMDPASILKKDSKKSKNDEKSLEQSDPPSTLKKKSKKSKTDEKCVEQTQSPSIPKKESKKSKYDEKSLEQSDPPCVLNKESKKSKTDEKPVEQTESPAILRKESENLKADEKCVEQSKENSKTSKENSATALILKFTNVDSIPSLTKLNEIFRCYGTVRETDTEILPKNNCAKVVFDEKSDAETAFSSAGKFSIFGPSLFSYRLDYSPTLRKIYSRNKKRNRKERNVGETNQSEDVAA